MVMAWIWREQAIAAVEKSRTGEFFYLGKLQACQYFYRCELPRVYPQLALLDGLDTSSLDMKDEWF